MFTVFSSDAGKTTKRRWNWPLKAQKRARALRLMETLSLGERRFVAVVEAEGQRLLIGATPQAVTLLGHLPSLPTPANLTERTPSSVALLGIH